ADRPLGFPIQYLLGPGRIWPPLLRIVDGHGLINDVDASRALDAILVLDFLHDLPHELGKLAYGEFVAVPDVDGSGLFGAHERDETVDEVVDVLERACLGPVAVYGHVLASEGLDDEVGDDTAVGWVHCQQPKKKWSVFSPRIG